MRALALVLVLASASTAAAQEREALIIGSSSVNGAIGRTIERELGERGIRVERRARSSSGFARPDFFDWEQEVHRLGRLERYDAVFIYAGGNDAQGLYLRPEERPSRAVRWVRWRDAGPWSDLYAERVREVVDRLCDAGAPRVIVLPPVDGGRDGWRERIVRVRDAQRRGAEASRCGVAIDANDGSAFSSSDGVHLTWTGARRMWTRIARPVCDLLDVTRVVELSGG